MRTINLLTMLLLLLGVTSCTTLSNTSNNNGNSPTQSPTVLMVTTDLMSPIAVPSLPTDFFSCPITQPILVSVDSEAPNPVLLHTIVGGYAGDIYFHGKFVYLRLGAVIFVFDVENPIEPYIVNCIRLPDAKAPLTFVDAGLFIGEFNKELYYVDLSNVHHLLLMEVVYQNKAYSFKPDLAISGNYAYVAERQEGLAVYDISNPILWVQVSQFQTEPGLNATRVNVGHQYISIIDDSNPSLGRKLYILDIANPNDIKAMGLYQLPINKSISTLITTDSYVYLETYSQQDDYQLSDSEPELVILDITDVRNIKSVGSYKHETVYPINTMNQCNMYLCFFEPGVGMFILDISNPLQPIVTGLLSLQANELISDMVFTDNYGFLSGGETGLFIVDITMSDSPVIVYNYAILGRFR